MLWCRLWAKWQTLWHIIAGWQRLQTAAWVSGWNVWQCLGWFVSWVWEIWHSLCSCLVCRLGVLCGTVQKRKRVEISSLTVCKSWWWPRLVIRAKEWQIHRDLCWSRSGCQQQDFSCQTAGQVLRRMAQGAVHILFVPGFISSPGSKYIPLFLDSVPTKWIREWKYFTVKVSQ